MNTQNKLTNSDPNKVKKCGCEDKYGPKPFNVSNVQQPNNQSKQ